MATWTTRSASALGGVALPIPLAERTARARRGSSRQRRRPVVPRGTPDRRLRPSERPVRRPGRSRECCHRTEMQAGRVGHEGPTEGSRRRVADHRRLSGVLPSAHPSSWPASAHFLPCSPGWSLRDGSAGGLAASCAGCPSRDCAIPRAEDVGFLRFATVARRLPIRRSSVWADSSGGRDELVDRSAGVSHEGPTWAAIDESGDVVEGVPGLE